MPRGGGDNNHALMMLTMNYEQPEHRVMAGVSVILQNMHNTRFAATWWVLWILTAGNESKSEIRNEEKIERKRVSVHFSECLFVFCVSFCVFVSLFVCLHVCMSTSMFLFVLCVCIFCLSVSLCLFAHGLLLVRWDWEGGMETGREGMET